MTLNLIKLCVGAESIEDLANWQARRLAPLKKKNKPLELQHVTRMMPKRKDELLDGGSLYWVIKGQIAVRQKLIDLLFLKLGILLGRGNNKVVPVFPQDRRKRLGDFRKKRMQQVGSNQTHEIGSPSDETPRRQVGPVVQFLDAR